MDSISILWPQIKDALTRPIEDAELSEVLNTDTDSRTTVYSGTIDDVNKYVSEMNWGDGLPDNPERIMQLMAWDMLRFCQKNTRKKNFWNKNS